MVRARQDGRAKAALAAAAAARGRGLALESDLPASITKCFHGYPTTEKTSAFMSHSSRKSFEEFQIREDCTSYGKLVSVMTAGLN